MTSMIEVDPDCTRCKLHANAVRVCQPGFGPRRAKVMVVSKMPNGDSWQDSLEADLAEVGFEPRDLYFASALKCRNFDDDASNVDVKACRPFLESEIDSVRPEWVIALGNEALLATTGHSGITKWRGRVVSKGGTSVLPTISPASVQRNPGQRQAYLADLRLALALTLGKQAKVNKPKRVLVANSKSRLRRLKERLTGARLIAYDVETRGLNEFDRNGCLVSLAGTVEGADGSLWAFAVPLCHPESPWFRSWRSVVGHLAPELEAIPKQVAHNGKFDARWMIRHGARMRITFDTMLAAHILDENRQKGLKPQAASRLGVAPWAIETKDLWTTPLRKVLWYNVLDTWYTYHIRKDMLPELVAQPRTRRIYQRVVLPANAIYVDAERRGVWMDRERLATRRHQTDGMVKMIEEELMQWVPSGAPEDLVELGWPQMGKRGKLADVNFNPSKFSRWLLFEHLGLPVLERGKNKPDGSPGDPSMKEGVMLALKDLHSIVPLLLKRSNWTKMGQFMSAYDALLDGDDRIHTTFKLAGTVTGRTSSGKIDEEKISGRADERRGINLQQVPRDPFARGLFGAAPGFQFVEADFSQVELRLIAFISRDPTMMRLFQMGHDIHAATASAILKIPPSKVTKDHRKKAKPVNFGFAYGMGAPKFVVYSFENYGVHFTLDEARAARKAYFDQFSMLHSWHARQRRLVHKHGYVESPIGRVRHLPDVRSADEKVVGEAERQAINSPVQSMGSDMMLIALRLIRAEFDRRGWTERGLAHIVGSVHDAGLFEIHESIVGPAMRVVKSCMEELLLETLETDFGCSLDVPIKADLKLGTHWGDAKELTEQQVKEWR